MTKILLFGYGKMGKMLEDVINASDDCTFVGSIDIEQLPSLPAMEKVADVIIDFSHPKMLAPLLEYASRTKTAIVSGTTGYTDEDMEKLKALSKEVPVLYSSNYSLGIAIMKIVLKQMRELIPSDFDIELIETHHNKKIDAPSGTAKALLDVLDEKEEHKKVYGREGMCGAREKGSIGVHAIRGGTVTGEHTVAFYGNNEVLEITHKAESRRVFAEGAVSASKKLVNMQAGFYALDDVLQS